MIAMRKQTALPMAGECCCGCGEPFGSKHVCYYNSTRVCTDCFEEFTAAERYEMDEWEDEWRRGDRIPGAVVAVLLAAFLVTVLVCWRFL